jgi:4-hydroxyphenylacetate 3-monooxygenase
VYPEARALHPMRALLPDWFTRVNDIIKTVGSHNLLAAANRRALDNPRIGALMDEFQPGANGMSASTRSEVYRVAWDFTGSLLGSRNELYERNYLTSAKTNRIQAHRSYSEANRQRGNELLDKLLSDARGR